MLSVGVEKLGVVAVWLSSLYFASTLRRAIDARKIGQLREGEDSKLWRYELGEGKEENWKTEDANLEISIAYQVSSFYHTQSLDFMILGDD